MDPRDPRYVRYQVPIPGVRQAQGAGDLFASLTRLLGFEKPCGPCEQRRRQMNQRVQFVPPGWPPRR